jgi:solute carrier family 10 (sodium/bile acid cotransporter), member 7
MSLSGVHGPVEEEGDEGIELGLAQRNAEEDVAEEVAAAPVAAAAAAVPRARICNAACCVTCGLVCCTRDSRAYKRFMDWHMPFGLVLAVLLGIVFPGPGAFVARETPLSTISIVYIFLVSGLRLQLSEIRRAVQSPWAALAGVVSILGVTPCLGFVLSVLPVGNAAISTGLALFVAMPTTVSTCVLFTGQAKGNQALALFFAVGTNVMGTVTIPFFLAAFLSAAGNAKFNAVGLLVNLLLTVLLPVVVGMALQYFSAVRQFVFDEADFFKVSSTALLVLVPWANISASHEDLLLLKLSEGGILVALAIATHLALLAINAVIVVLLPRTGMPERKAFFLSASQKTIAIAVAVIAQLPPAVGSLGIIAVVCIVSHFVQSIIDAFLAVRMAPWDEMPCSLHRPVPADLEEENPADNL